MSESKKYSLLSSLIEQVVLEVVEELEEQNALAGGGVSATSTGGALTADKKKHKDKTGNGTRHDLLWAGDEPLSEQVQGDSFESVVLSAIEASSGEMSLDDFVRANRELRLLDRLRIRKFLGQLSKIGKLSYEVSLQCDGEVLFSGPWEKYESLSNLKLQFLKRKCKEATSPKLVEKIRF